MFKNILVPLDESELSERALPVGKDLAGRLGATLHLLEAIQPQAELFSGRGMGPESIPASRYEVEAIQHFTEEQMAKARNYLAEVAQTCHAEGLQARTEVRESAAAESIKAYAEDNDVDLIIMSTHGRGGIHRMLIGSVTDRVVRSVEIPVLVIPRP